MNKETNYVKCRSCNREAHFGRDFVVYHCSYCRNVTDTYIKIADRKNKDDKVIGKDIRVNNGITNVNSIFNG